MEVSEVVEHFQWLTEEQSANLLPEKLAELREDIGDVMIYLTELADKLRIDPVGLPHLHGLFAFKPQPLLSV